MRDFKKLRVRKKAHQLNMFVYLNFLPKFLKSEQFDLMNQAKRAANSISLNIVEGTGGFTKKDFGHFLDLALVSAYEPEYYTLLKKDLSYVDQELYRKLNQHINKVKAMFIGLIKTIRK